MPFKPNMKVITTSQKYDRSIWQLCESRSVNAQQLHGLYQLQNGLVEIGEHRTTGRRKP
jgi:hypothetical protein